MRTTSIISMLRKSGRLSRKLRSRIKYKDALMSLKAYQNSELKLVRMIDNGFSPSRSMSHKCQIPGCGMAIRYEYILQSKITEEIIVAGSTCVWIMLGLSEQQIKDFNKIETSIKDFHDMIAWRKNNMDVWDKLMELKKADVEYYKPFWEEVEFCRLHPDDEAYIRTVDVASAIKKDQDWKTRKNSWRTGNRTPATVSTPAPVVSSAPANVGNPVPFAAMINDIIGNVTVANNAPVSNNPNTIKNDPSITGEDDASYMKVVNTLKRLTNKYPQDTALKSINAQEESGKLLTMNQVNKVKVEALKDYYEVHIKGTPEQINYDNCDNTIMVTFNEYVNTKAVRMYIDDINSMKDKRELVHMIRKYKKQFNTLIEKSVDADLKKFWNYFRIKHEIVLK